MAVVKDLSGQRFGKLIAIEVVGKSKTGNMIWECKCDCGNTKNIWSTALVSGNTKSCGCSRVDAVHRRKDYHGDKAERLYHIWGGMLVRCNPKCAHRSSAYSAKGIKVCDEWKDYRAFRKWALANGYRDDLTIDRIDVNGDYEPSNCRFATQKEQQNNRSNNHRITYNGETKTLAQWAEIVGINASAISKRIRRGWAVDEALTVPLGGRI